VRDTGCWILDAGYWMLDTGCWILDAGFSQNPAGWFLVIASLIENLFIVELSF